MNCIICNKIVPLIKGRTKTQSAKMCRATILKGGTRIASQCQKTYRNEWHRFHYVKADVKPKLDYKGIVNTCLKCDREFNAESKFNRICSDCQLSNDNYIDRHATLLVAS